MSCDEYLLDCLIRGLITKPILRVYGWSEETVSLGVNQDINSNETKSCLNSFPFVKRVTGGQAVVHKSPQDELTYSVLLFYTKSAKKLYLEIGDVLFSFLRQLGLNPVFGNSSNYLNDFNCFNSKTSADILVNDVKVIGSAQCRKKKFILHHDSIRLDLIRKLSLRSLYFNEAIVLLKRSFEEVCQINFQEYSLYEKTEDIDKCFTLAS